MPIIMDSWILVMILGICAVFLAFASADEIHCYCNLEECAETRSKCRSQLGRCFSKMRDDPQPGDEDDSIHGCVESLAMDERTSCLSTGRGDVISRKTNDASNTLPILMCCTANMCNYIDQVDPPHVAIDVFTTNQSQKESSHINKFYPGSQSGEYYSSQEVWFKAAVIAVPIAGGVILVILVLLAVRMLRYDSRRQYEIKRNQSLAKAQLYVADHFSNFYPAPTHVYTDKTCVPLDKESNETGALYQSHSATCQSNCNQCSLDCVKCDLPERTRAMSCTSLTHTATQNIIANNSGGATPGGVRPQSQSAHEHLQKSCCSSHTNCNCVCCNKNNRTCDHSQSRDHGCACNLDQSRDEEESPNQSFCTDDEGTVQSAHEERVTDRLLQSQNIV